MYVHGRRHRRNHGWIDGLDCVNDVRLVKRKDNPMVGCTKRGEFLGGLGRERRVITNRLGKDKSCYIGIEPLFRPVSRKG